MPSRESPRFGRPAPARLARPVERAADRARVAEVVAHEPLDPLARLGARIAEHLGRPLLQLVTEHVLVAAASRCRIDRTRSRKSSASSRRPGSAGPRRSSSGSVSDGNRARRHQIAQGARRLLHVGLELIERVVEAGVPLLDELQQRSRGRSACVAGVWNSVVSGRTASRGPATRRASSSASRNSGLSVSSSLELVQLPYLVADRPRPGPTAGGGARGGTAPRRPDRVRRTGAAGRCRSGGTGAGARSRRAR
jgi:hypothetical protein